MLEINVTDQQHALKNDLFHCCFLNVPEQTVFSGVCMGMHSAEVL